jgi:hypothetical protein
MGRGSDGGQFPQPDWALTCTVGGGAITAQKGNDATVAWAGTGLLDVTLGAGGVDSTESKIDVDYDGAAGLTCQTTHTSATVKRLKFTAGSNGAAADPTRVGVVVKRLSVH